MINLGEAEMARLIEVEQAIPSENSSPSPRRVKVMAPRWSAS